MEFTTVDTFLHYYSKVKKRTKRVIDCVPPDKIEWTYREDKFTVGDLIRHLANAERYLFAENAQQKPSQYQGCGEEYAKGYEKVVQYYDQMYQETVEVLSGFQPEDFHKKCKTPTGAEITVWKWLRLLVEHEIHHRGQLYIYLGMLGVTTPPIYGLTSERVIELSTPEQSEN